MLNIKEIEFSRKSKQIAQDQFAKDIGITRNTYQNLLKNHDFRLSQLVKISEILEIPFFELFEKKAENGNIYIGHNSANGNKIEIGNNKIELLKQENKYLKEKIELLENMIDVLKNK